MREFRIEKFGPESTLQRLLASRGVRYYGFGMAIEQLRIIAFCVYLGSWIVLAAAAIAGGIPRRQRNAAASIGMTMPVMVGMLLQSIAALPITLSLGDGPLRPRTFELIGTLALAPLAALLFTWALGSVRTDTEAQTLVTGGAYAWLRHPIYLAFLAMLLATGLLASARLTLLVATALYVAGSEMRIASEEAELHKKFPSDYAQYRLKTRWRYLPGLR
jgi:protein-S-isoprenylcysteine O-methyltransferase Ste14